MSDKNEKQMAMHGKNAPVEHIENFSLIAIANSKNPEATAAPKPSPPPPPPAPKNTPPSSAKKN